MIRGLCVLLLLGSSVYGETVVGVVDGRTLVLSSGEIVQLKGLDFPPNPTEHQLEQSKRALQLWALDREVVLKNQEDVGWGMLEADVIWRGVDIGQTLQKTRYLVRVGQPNAIQRAADSPKFRSPTVVRRRIYVAPPVRYRTNGMSGSGET